jgi:glycosyltransferase involved in cell wall biosynthesis
MKILHVGPSLIELPAKKGGAVERRMVALATAQSRMLKDPVVLFGAQLAGPEHECTENVVFVRRGGGSGWLRRGRFLVGLGRHIWKSKPDIIIVHNSIEIPLFLRLIGFGGIISLIRDNHLPPGSSVPMISKLSYLVCYVSIRCADIRYFVSTYCQAVNSTYWRLPAHGSSVLYNGVDLQWFRFEAVARDQIRKRLGFHQSDIVVGYVGRVCLQKGTDVLVESFRRVRTVHTDVKLLVVGPCGQFENEGSNVLVDSICDSGGLYLGPVDEGELPGIFSAIDIFVMPTVELEMFGMAAVEAAACGCFIVASNHGGLPEALEGTGSMLFFPGDVTELSQTITDAANGIRARDGRRPAGSTIVDCLARFSWPRLAMQTLEDCRRML